MNTKKICLSEPAARKECKNTSCISWVVTELWAKVKMITAKRSRELHAKFKSELSEDCHRRLLKFLKGRKRNLLYDFLFHALTSGQQIDRKGIQDLFEYENGFFIRWDEDIRIILMAVEAWEQWKDGKLDLSDQ